MNKETSNLIHGRETYVVYYGPDFILKRPLPTTLESEKPKWLAKQIRTKETIDLIRSIGNPRYNIPEMKFINGQEFQILEERAHGYPLTPELFKTVNPRQRYEIIDGIASFLVDMNESRQISDLFVHKISEDIKFNRLTKFIDEKMSKWFTSDEVKFLARIRDEVGTFEYETRTAWSHGDLNSGNVLYDPLNSQLSFIDFAEADHRFIYRDIFSPLQIELDIWNPVYETYTKLHNKSLYEIPSPRNDKLRTIMKYRIICVLLRRIIKASDDLRANPQSDKGHMNNLNKVNFIRQQIKNIEYIESAIRTK